MKVIDANTGAEVHAGVPSVGLGVGVFFLVRDWRAKRKKL
jgi:hypothetical protein